MTDTYAEPAMWDETKADMPLILDHAEKDVRDLFSVADTQVDGAAPSRLPLSRSGRMLGLPRRPSLASPPHQFPQAHSWVPCSPPGEVTAEEGGR